jgi:hypothetical protein
MAVLLTLGGILFQGFEVPESIATGGDQALVVHKLPGGARLIDAMGADNRDIAWSGRFRGNAAESRARRLDGYRIAGQALELAWSGYRYQVLVRSFEAQFMQPFEIPYSISCTVLADEAAPILSGIPGLDEIIGADLVNALTLGGAINVASVSGAIATVQTVVGAVNTLKNAPAGSIANIAATVGLAQQAALSATTQAEGTLAAAGALTPGNSPTSLISSLTAQASGFGQLSNLYQMTSTLGRMGKNLGVGS